MVNRKLSRKKIMSKSSKIRTKKVGGGKWKSTKKSLSHGVNRVMALGGLSSKARARVRSRQIYNNEFKSLLGSKKRQIANLKKDRKGASTNYNKLSLSADRYLVKEQLKTDNSLLKELAAKKYQNNKSKKLFNTKIKLLKKAAESKKFLNRQSKNDVEFLRNGIKKFRFGTASNKNKRMFNNLVEKAIKQLKSGTGLGVGLGSLKTLREYKRRKNKIEGAKKYIEKHQSYLSNQGILTDNKKKLQDTLGLTKPQITNFRNVSGNTYAGERPEVPNYPAAERAAEVRAEAEKAEAERVAAANKTAAEEREAERVRAAVEAEKVAAERAAAEEREAAEREREAAEARAVAAEAEVNKLKSNLASLRAAAAAEARAVAAAANKAAAEEAPPATRAANKQVLELPGSSINVTTNGNGRKNGNGTESQI